MREEVAEAFRQRGLSVVTDARNEKINAKIREHSLQHVPVIAVVGRKEAEDRTVALRRLGGQAQEVFRWTRRWRGLPGGRAARYCRSALRPRVCLIRRRSAMTVQNDYRRAQ